MNAKVQRSTVSVHRRPWKPVQIVSSIFWKSKITLWSWVNKYFSSEPKAGTRSAEAKSKRLRDGKESRFWQGKSPILLAQSGEMDSEVEC